MREPSVFTDFLGDYPIVRVISFLIENLPLDAPKEEIIRATGVSRTSFFAVWERLERYGVVKRTRTVGRSAMFALEPKSGLAQHFMKLELELIDRSAPVPVRTGARRAGRR